MVEIPSVGLFDPRSHSDLLINRFIPSNNCNISGLPIG